MKNTLTLVGFGLLFWGAPMLRNTAMAQSQKQAQAKPQLEGPSKQSTRRTTALMADEVRHQLVTLPFYGVFDWLEGEVQPDGTVVIRGEVTHPTTKSDAEKRLKSIESVARVTNQIEVLPLSQNDDQIRRQIYNAIFRFDSPLFQYALRAVPPIHIIVKGGHVTLKGIVMNSMDRQLAEIAARGVPGVFDVKNELKVESSAR